MTTSGYCAQKEWTFMVFLNADNNLDSAGVDDLEEMQKVGSDSNINVVVQIDREHSGTKRLYVNKGTSTLLENMGEVDMGNWKNLVSFVKFSIEKYPAKKYALVIWNHGSGWKTPVPVFKGISYDDTNGTNIETGELGLAMAQIKTLIGKEIDILGFDACLMNMLEVCYEVKDSVSYVVGSEETEPGDGWPYNTVLGELSKAPKMKAAQFAYKIVKKYISSYYALGLVVSVTQSAVNCKALRYTAKIFDEVSEILIKKFYSNKNMLFETYAEVQKFVYKDYVSLFHLVDLIAKKTNDVELKAKLKSLKNVESLVVLKNGKFGFKTTKARGLSIYFPGPEMYYYSFYKNLSFSKVCRWGTLLSMLHKKYFVQFYKKLLSEYDPGTVNSKDFLHRINGYGEYLQNEVQNGDHENAVRLLDYLADSDLRELELSRPLYPVLSEVLRGYLVNKSLDMFSKKKYTKLLREISR